MGIPIRWLDALAAAALLTMGIALLSGQYGALQRNVESERTQLLTSAAGRLEASINGNLARAEAAARAAAAYLEALPDLDPQRFAVFAEQMLRGQSAMRALQWEPRVIESQRADFEAYWQQRGLAGFALRDADASGLVPARARPVSFPILAGYALDGPLPLGLVAASEISVESPPLDSEPDFIEFATVAQASARDLAEPRITAAYAAVTPVEDTGVPEVFRRSAFSLRMPVYARPPGTAIEDRRALLDGYAVAFVALPTLLQAAREAASAQNIAFRLHDLSDGGEQLLYLHGNGGTAFVAHHELVLPVLGRQWRLQMMAPPPAGLSEAVLLGQLLSGLAVLLLLVLGWLRARQRAHVLGNAQRRLRELTDALPVGVFQGRPDGDSLQVNYVNRGAARLLQRDEEALVHRPAELFDFLDPDERAALLAGLRHSLQQGVGVQRELLATVDGSLRRLQLTALPRRSGGEALVDGVLEDVTALRKAGEQLEAFADEQAVIIDSLPFGLLFAERGHITRANPALAQILGHVDAEELVGRPLQGLHADEADYRRLRKAAAIRLKAGKLFSSDWTLVRRDGEAFAARVVGRKLLDDGHGRELWVVIDNGAAAAAAHSDPA